MSGLGFGLKKIFTLGWVTFLELLREKLFYGALLLGLFLFGLTLLASQLTYINSDRILTSYGMSAIHLALHGMAVLLGAGLILKEMETRTAHLILSRPVSGLTWIAGKSLGLGLLLLSNGFLLGVVLWIILGQSFGRLMIASVALVVPSAWVLGQLTLMFSVFSTRAVSIFWGIGLYLIGGNTSAIRAAALSKDLTPILKAVLKGIEWCVPDFEKFTLGLDLIYQATPPVGWIGQSSLYALVWGGIGLLGSALLLKKREF